MTLWSSLSGKAPLYTVGPGTGADYTSLTTACGTVASGSILFVDPSYSSPSDTIKTGNLTIVFGTLRGSASITTLTFDSSGASIHSIDIFGGQFETVTFSASGGNNISDIRFFGTEISTGATAGGINYVQGSVSGSYVQQIDWFGCRFDDLGGASGYLHNVSGTATASAGGYNTHGCKYVASGTGTQQCFFFIPMGQQMGTDCTHEDLMFTNLNTTGTTYALLVGGTTSGSGATTLNSFKFSHCYFEAHGTTIGAYIGANSTSNSVHLYILFDEGTYNIDTGGSWQIWNVNNTNWEPHASHGISGVAMHYGHRQGPNAPATPVSGTQTADYIPELVDPKGFVS
jgi:hypothetical protein